MASKFHSDLAYCCSEPFLQDIQTYVKMIDEDD